MIPTMLSIRRAVFVASVTLSVIHCASLRADDLEQELQAAIGEVKKQSGITNSSKEPQQEVRTHEGDTSSQGDVTQTPFAADNLNILSHVTLPDGIEFPKPEQIILEPTPSPTPEPLDLAVSTPVREEPYRRPGKCEKNTTTRTVIRPDKPETRTFYDVLYLPEELVPVDPAEVFGPEVELQPYGPTSDEAVYISMRVDGVPCVPYRVRITLAARYEDFGNNALRNYSKDPAGKGTLDIRMQKKLAQSK